MKYCSDLHEFMWASSLYTEYVYSLYRIYSLYIIESCSDWHMSLYVCRVSLYTYVLITLVFNWLTSFKNQQNKWLWMHWNCILQQQIISKCLLAPLEVFRKVRYLFNGIALLGRCWFGFKDQVKNNIFALCMCVHLSVCVCAF